MQPWTSLSIIRCGLEIPSGWGHPLPFIWSGTGGMGPLGLLSIAWESFPLKIDFVLWGFVLDQVGICACIEVARWLRELGVELSTLCTWPSSQLPYNQGWAVESCSFMVQTHWLRARPWALLAPQCPVGSEMEAGSICIFCRETFCPHACRTDPGCVTAPFPPQPQPSSELLVLKRL